jgi:NTE family protein
MSINPLNTKIGLALGGGAAKGIAHIGVIKCLEEDDIDISYISGTSIGSLVASFYAFGKTVEQMLTISETLSISRVTSFTLRKRGFFTTESIRELVIKELGNVNIEDANIPLAILAADITTGEEIIFRHGPLTDAICASVAVPGIYIPVELQGRLLVDGGIVENVPISPLKKMGAGIIIAVDLNGISRYRYPKDIMDVMGNAFDIAIDLRTRDQIKSADLVISMDLSQFSRVDNTKRVQELMNVGYYTTKNKIPKLFLYQKTKLLQIIKKFIIQTIPLKMPLFISKYFKRKIQTVLK